MKAQFPNSQWAIAPNSVAVHPPFERVTDCRGWLTMLKGEILLGWVGFPG